METEIIEPRESGVLQIYFMYRLLRTTEDKVTVVYQIVRTKNYKGLCLSCVL